MGPASGPEESEQANGGVSVSGTNDECGMTNVELPKGWAKTTLEDIARDVTYGYTAKSNRTSGGAKMLRITDIQDNRVDWSQVPFCAISATDKVKYLLKKWDLVFARTGATVGKSFLIQDNVTDAVFASYLIRVRCIDNGMTSYLRYFFNSPAYWNQITDFSAGIGQPNVNGSKLKGLVIPLAPLAEQKRIADKLEAVLGRVDACRARLNRVPAFLKRFRQSVLAGATSGGLTAEWRMTNGVNDEWEETQIQHVANVGTGSTPLRSNTAFFAPKGTPWVTSAATSKKLVTKSEEFVTDAAIKAHRLKKYPVGTLLVAMYDEGKTRGQVTELGIEATINQACAAIVVDESIITKRFVKFSLEANYLEMRELAEGGNQPNLNLSKIKEFPIGLPTLPEQQEIVRRVEDLYAFADRIEVRLAIAQKTVERLTPATLAKAFRGELVPQDPNDEPASALLERLKSAEPAPSTTKTRRKRSATV